MLEKDAHDPFLRCCPEFSFIDDFVPTGSYLYNSTGLAFGPDGNLYVGSYNSYEVLRFDGDTGEFMDAYVDALSGGLYGTYYFSFIPEQQVHVIP